MPNCPPSIEKQLGHHNFFIQCPVKNKFLFLQSSCDAPLEFLKKNHTKNCHHRNLPELLKNPSFKQLSFRGWIWFLEPINKFDLLPPNGISITKKKITGSGSLRYLQDVGKNPNDRIRMKESEAILLWWRSWWVGGVVRQGGIDHCQWDECRQD